MARVFVATVFIFVVLFAELPKAIDSCQKNLATQTIEPYPGCIGKFQSEVCVGYCLSSQIPDLDSFIFHHPVCNYVGQRTRSRLINWNWNCSSDYNPRPNWFNSTEPINCTCSVCDSSNTSCQSPNKRTMNSPVRFQPSSRRIYIPVAEPKKRKEWDFEYPPSIYLI